VKQLYRVEPRSYFNVALLGKTYGPVYRFIFTPVRNITYPNYGLRIIKTEIKCAADI